MRDEFARAVAIVVMVLVSGAVCYGCKSWQYRECKAVGHDSSYCLAQAAGCFGGGGRR